MTLTRSTTGRARARPSLFAPSAGTPRQSEPVVPMINVVFLLLIFFLMTAEIAPPDPFEVDLPANPATEPAPAGDTIYLSANGEIAFGALRGTEAIAAAGSADSPLNLRADARADASALARLLADLARAGAGTVTLITREAGK